jgi:hypothetical protein
VGGKAEFVRTELGRLLDHPRMPAIRVLLGKRVRIMIGALALTSAYVEPS